MNKKFFRLTGLLTIMAFAMFFTYGCDSDDPATIPTVTTGEVTDVTGVSAVGSGNVTSDGGDAVSSRGLVYSTEPNPTLSNNLATAGAGDGQFTANLSGLTPETTYYVKAFAINNEGTAYGDEASFTTLEAPRDDPEMVDPGNWANRGGATIYTWGEGNGYIFGTNTYGDAGYAQVFNVTRSHDILSAYFWIGSKAGTEGEVVFTVWDYSSGNAGAVLGSKTYSMANVQATLNLNDAMFVEFDEVITAPGHFLIGVDITGLNAFEDGVYYLGHVSSEDGDGAEGGLALALEGSSWVPVLNYGVDVDIAIFPIVQGFGKSGDAGIEVLSPGNQFREETEFFRARTATIGKAKGN